MYHVLINMVSVEGSCLSMIVDSFFLFFWYQSHFLALCFIVFLTMLFVCLFLFLFFFYAVTWRQVTSPAPTSRTSRTEHTQSQVQAWASTLVRPWAHTANALAFCLSEPMHGLSPLCGVSLWFKPTFLFPCLSGTVQQPIINFSLIAEQVVGLIRGICCTIVFQACWLQ